MRPAVEAALEGLPEPSPPWECIGGPMDGRKLPGVAVREGARWVSFPCLAHPRTWTNEASAASSSPRTARYEVDPESRTLRYAGPE